MDFAQESIDTFPAQERLDAVVPHRLMQQGHLGIPGILDAIGYQVDVLAGTVEVTGDGVQILALHFGPNMGRQVGLGLHHGDLRPTLPAIVQAGNGLIHIRTRRSRSIRCAEQTNTRISLPRLQHVEEFLVGGIYGFRLRIGRVRVGVNILIALEQGFLGLPVGFIRNVGQIV